MSLEYFSGQRVKNEATLRDMLEIFLSEFVAGIQEQHNREASVYFNSTRVETGNRQSRHQSHKAVRFTGTSQHRQVKN